MLNFHRILLLLLHFSVASVALANELESDADKLSYTLGVNFAKGIDRNLKQQGITIEPTPFAAGIADYFQGNKLQLDDSTQEQQLNQLQDDLVAKLRTHVVKQAQIHYQELFSDQGYPFAGAQDAPITLVQFFDYQCPHCKNMQSVLTELLAKHQDVRLIYRDLPVLGPTSQLAAKAALSAFAQGQYLAVHDALLQTSNPLTEKKILAATATLDRTKLMAAAQAKETLELLQTTFQLARKLGIKSTPMFLLGHSVSETTTAKSHQVEFLTGQQSLSALEASLNKIRS